LEAESGFLSTGCRFLLPEIKSTIEKSALKKFEEFHPIAYKFVVYWHISFSRNIRGFFGLT